MEISTKFQSFTDKIDTLDFEVFNLHETMQGEELGTLLVFLL